MHSEVELNNRRMQLLDRFQEILPEVRAAQFNTIDVVYQDGALSKKVKRLMSLAMAIGMHCANCTLSQTNRSLEAGATIDEILEVLSVVVCMMGNSGIAESLKVIDFLDESGKLPG